MGKIIVKTKKIKVYYSNHSGGKYRRYRPLKHWRTGTTCQDGHVYPHGELRIPLFFFKVFFDIFFVWYGFRLRKKWFVLDIWKHNLICKIESTT
jgi:hypothetical protein